MRSEFTFDGYIGNKIKVYGETCTLQSNPVFLEPIMHRDGRVDDAQVRADAISESGQEYEVVWRIPSEKNPECAGLIWMRNYWMTKRWNRYLKSIKMDDAIFSHAYPIMPAEDEHRYYFGGDKIDLDDDGWCVDFDGAVECGRESGEFPFWVTHVIVSPNGKEIGNREVTKIER